MTEYDLNTQFRGQRPSPLVAQDVTDAAVILEDHERILCSLIREHPLVVGCFAWLSSFPILDALGTTWCDIVLGAEPYHITAEKMRALGGNRYNLVEDISGEPTDARQVDVMRRRMTSRFHYMQGAHGLQSYNKSLMHSKFLLFGTPTPKPTDFGPLVTVCREAFTGVWIGSYNPTSNARNSIETAIILRSPTLAGQLFDEYRRLRLASQPLACTPPYNPPPLPDHLQRLFDDLEDDEKGQDPEPKP